MRVTEEIMFLCAAIETHYPLSTTNYHLNSMLNSIKIALRFFKFYLKAKTKYNVHSPFVFEFVNGVLEENRQFYVFKEAEILRGQLLSSKDVLEVEDFGAGSHKDGTKKQRRVRDIAASALSPAFQCQWLFHICNTYKPLTIIELGTSLGISTLYIAEGSPKETQIFSLEGSPTIAQTARRNFDWFYNTFNKIGLKRANLEILKYTEIYEKLIPAVDTEKRIKIVEGNFNKTLQNTLSKIGKLDLAFLDGNHRYEPTIQYFQQALAHTHEGSILIFDDIHWSEDMEKAWSEIQNHPSVRLTIDLFWCGLVFFRNENKEKEHFQLIKSKLKPFSWGLW
jgi:predicted O-methyltransferase YrrM